MTAQEKRHNILYCYYTHYIDLRTNKQARKFVTPHKKVACRLNLTPVMRWHSLCAHVGIKAAYYMDALAFFYPTCHDAHKCSTFANKTVLVKFAWQGFCFFLKLEKNRDSLVYPQACTLTKQINCAPFPVSITKKLRNYEEKKSELLVQFCGFISHCYFFFFSFRFAAMLQPRADT